MLEMNFKILYTISIIYAVGMTAAAWFIQDMGMFRNIYYFTMLIAAIFLILLGIEDNNTLRVSWKNTFIYLTLMLPGVGYGCLSGALLEQIIYYLPGAAFVVVMIIYSFKTGRGGADRDIGLLGIIAFPQTAVLSLIPSLLISIIATAKRKEKYPFIFPYSIIFGILTFTQITMLISQVMI